MVGSALRRVVTELQGADRYVWVVTAYLLSSTATIPAYGNFSDVGLGAAGILPVALAAIGDLFDAHERGRYRASSRHLRHQLLIGPLIGG